MCDARFQAQPSTQSLIVIHFWRGALREVGDSTHFPGPNFQGANMTPSFS